jgi:hypothetical protein
MRDERANLLKVTRVMRYLPSIDRERAQRYWRTHHAALGRKVTAMPWYLQNHCGRRRCHPQPLAGLPRLSES